MSKGLIVLIVSKPDSLQVYHWSAHYWLSDPIKRMKLGEFNNLQDVSINWNTQATSRDEIMSLTEWIASQRHLHILHVKLVPFSRIALSTLLQVISPIHERLFGLTLKTDSTQLRYVRTERASIRDGVVGMHITFTCGRETVFIDSNEMLSWLEQNGFVRAI